MNRHSRFITAILAILFALTAMGAFAVSAEDDGGDHQGGASVAEQQDPEPDPEPKPDPKPNGDDNRAQVPQTGDSLATAPIATLALAGLALVLVSLLRRKEEDAA